MPPPRVLDADGLWDYALKALGGRALSAAELRERLRRRAGNKEDVEPVISRLRDYGFLNDSRMAENFAAARLESRGFGQSRVLRDLQRRRVASGVARTAVERAFAGTDETQLIEAWLARKYRGKNLPEYLGEEKNLASVFRRLRYAGFRAAPAISVLKRYAARADELPEDDEPAPA
ncbi:MAG TPA: regulatory protein RecX [Bryobacteraceae bacterium]|nr:regulatory protein RecX [Bryobacteraceae bacterium]